MLKCYTNSNNISGGIRASLDGLYASGVVVSLKEGGYFPKTGV